MTDLRIDLPQQRASDPRVTAWVSANAGSGKTHVLVDRVIRLMLRGSDPASILCLTYTKAAAAEMVERLFERLSSWISLEDKVLAQQLHMLGMQDVKYGHLLSARRLFARALETPGGLKIQTIHAFCEHLLQLFPVEAGIVPGFEIMDQSQMREVRRRAREEVLAIATMKVDSVFGQSLALIINYTQYERFEEILTALLDHYRDYGDLLSGAPALNQAKNLFHEAASIDKDENFESLYKKISGMDRILLKKLILVIKGTTSKNGLKLLPALEELLHCHNDADFYALVRRIFFTNDMKPRQLSGFLKKQDFLHSPYLADFILDEQKRLLPLLSQFSDLKRIEVTLALLTLASAMIERFEHIKRGSGLFDFDDLIAHTRTLLTASPSAAWVLRKLDARIEHVLVDEAQDTSPEQWQIISALTEEFFAGLGGHEGAERTVFAVGDRKQSIFSFQGANPYAFEAAEQQFKEKTIAAGQIFQSVDFTLSFRSRPAILEAVDRVFAPGREARQGLETTSSRDFLHRAYHQEFYGMVEIWPLMIPLEKEEINPWQMPVDHEAASAPRRRLARHIAKKIKSWIGKRQLEGLKRFISPGDILILVRRRNSLFEAMISELRRESIPVAGADRLKLQEHLAILDLLSLAKFCLLPEDDYNLACLLKSPLISRPFSEEQIFTLCYDRKELTLCESLVVHEPEIARELEMWRSSSLKPFDFFAYCVQARRQAILQRFGVDANDALDAFIDLVQSYEQNHTPSLAGFLHWFSAGSSELKRDMQQTSDEVRIITVHGAKGLEGQIVILPDMVDIPDMGKEPFVEIDLDAKWRLPLWKVPGIDETEKFCQWKVQAEIKEHEEYRRLLYVAMTRPREELYICGAQGHSRLSPLSWYSMVEGALKPVMTEVRDEKGEIEAWRLGQAPCFLEDDIKTFLQSPPLEQILPDWMESKPVQNLKPEPPSIMPTRTKTAKDTKHFARGTFIHKMLHYLSAHPGETNPENIYSMVERQGYGRGLADQLFGLLKHPELADFFDGDALTEVDIKALLPDGREISGRIDRLIHHENYFLILDYKTDELIIDPLPVEHPYYQQLALYHMALQQVYPDKNIRAGLIWTSRPCFSEIKFCL